MAETEEEKRRKAFPTYQRRFSNKVVGGENLTGGPMVADVAQQDNPFMVGLNRVNPVQDISSSGLVPSKQGIQELPSLFMPDGKLNPEYDTSKGQDVLAGLKIGTQLGMGQDPFFQLGAMLGGALGGVVNKNLAGKQQYKEDTQLIAQRNQMLMEQTLAEQQIASMKIKDEVTQRGLDLRQNALEFRMKLNDTKDWKEEGKILTDTLSAIPASENEQRFAIMAQIQKHYAKKGIMLTDEMVASEGFGVKYTPVKVGDTFMMVSNDGSRVEQMYDPITKKPVTNLGLGQFAQIYKTLNNGNEFTAGAADYDAAWKQANEIVAANTKNNKNIKEGQKINIATTLMLRIAKSNGPLFSGAGTGGDDMKQKLNQALKNAWDSSEYKTDVKVMDEETPVTTESPFMPPLDGDTTVVQQPVADKVVNKTSDELWTARTEFGYNVVTEGGKRVEKGLIDPKLADPEAYFKSYKSAMGANSAYRTMFSNLPDEVLIFRMAERNRNTYRGAGEEGDFMSVNQKVFNYARDENKRLVKPIEIRAVDLDPSAVDTKGAVTRIGKIAVLEDNKNYLVGDYNEETKMFRLFPVLEVKKKDKK